MVDLTRQPESPMFVDRTGDELGQALAEFLITSNLARPVKPIENQSKRKIQSKPFVKTLDWDALSQVILEPETLSPAEQKAIEEWFTRKKRSK